MKLLFSNIFHLLAEYVLCVKDRCRYFEFDNVPKEVYLFADTNCDK